MPNPKAGLITKAKNTTETRPTNARAKRVAFNSVFFMVCVCYFFTDLKL